MGGESYAGTDYSFLPSTAPGIIPRRQKSRMLAGSRPRRSTACLAVMCSTLVGVAFESALRQRYGVGFVALDGAFL